MTTQQQLEKAQAKAAFAVETRIKGTVRAMRTMWIQLAQDLHEFQKGDM